MAKSSTIVFFMCIVVVVGSLQFSRADMTAERDTEIEMRSKLLQSEISNVMPQFKSCVETCAKACIAKDSANTSCHSTCDKDCMKKEVVDKISDKLGIRN
ncbi:major pollen allergen Ole e 6-like [Cucumis melo var. makuwa]|uniref:Major pollen allergen Ole e 6-like n=1 Tax=Cucumis melo var. makuwa TaxID=1194695 RepID=A0A5A7T3F9_CUCMM|nr:major pollen allergen Ole e 6-like [Cucumis melo var. makuwa]